MDIKKKSLWMTICLCCCLGVMAQSGTQQPNIILIMVDDMGYSDIGCYGGEVETPNLDKLAMGGLRFTNFHNNARCSPTRASILTGQYAHKVGLSQNGNALTYNGTTIAELLKANGYQTAMVGKWHLSDDIQKPTKEDQLKWLNHQAFNADEFASKASYPINRGFQKHYGIIWGVVNYFDPFSLVNGEKTIFEVPEDYYITDAFNEKAVEYVKEFAGSKQPFFLYLAHAAPHWPIHAKEEDIAKYEGKYDIGWDELRKQRYERMVKMRLVDPATTPLLPVMGRLGSWESLSAEEKKKQSKKMAVHAAMIDRVDQGIGKLIQTLKETNMYDNTLIIFLSDNGASPEIVTVPGYDRPSETRRGVTHQYADQPSAENIGREISYTGIGQNWANASNTPFRYWKVESFEGGICTPMFVHWPKGLKTKPGSINGSLGHVMDIFPTLLEVSGTPYPQQYNGHGLTAVDGLSILPVLNGKAQGSRNSIFFEHARGKAYIRDNMKLVMRTSGDQWELYDLSKDRNEANNIAAANATLVAQLKQEWENWYNGLKPYIKPRAGSGPQ